QAIFRHVRGTTYLPNSGESGSRPRKINHLPTDSQRGLFKLGQGKSVRVIPDDEFAAIVRAGLRATLDPTNSVRLDLDRRHADADTIALLAAPHAEQERRITQILMNKKIRDAAFRRVVVDAYDGRCAVTGLRIINGGGKAEAQAAHIWAVGDGGPDVVQNGIALSATVHWLFDRHLISLTDDFGLLVSHNKVPGELRSLFTPQLERIQLPANRKLWPNPVYVARHRERFADA
ncbi:HNH endonuclease, partial [Dankookia sp. GCM10030260]|uniref:HNH endonuclease n=1 Tax=Dankookia sp. GCM10030260 TaxID=3273390 RepID=UPI0036140BCA